MFGAAKTKGLVGLDLGSSSIKTIELGRKGNQYEVVNLAVAELPEGAIVDGAIKDGAAVARAIGKLFADNHITTPNVATSVSGHSVIVKKITVAGESPDQLADAIAEEAEQSLQLDLDEVKWDYHVLGPASGRNAYEVMLVAVKRDKLASYTNVVEQAGKRAVVVDTDAFALENAFEMSYQPPRDQVVALVDIGASTTNINIVCDGVPLFTRDLSTGAAQLTETFAKGADLGSSTTGQPERGRVENEAPSEVRAAQIRLALEPLLQEIHKTFDFFKQTGSVGAIQHLYVAGGVACMPNLAGILQEQLGIATAVMNPFQRVTFQNSKWDVDRIREVAPRLGVAMGLALRNFD
ncbi:MAG TPA: type IV pilus assembly protein PilM [Terriglobia bacterium]|nr:type IV pilus assembly protein PilM [Terriglobia bacterium]